MITTQKFTRVKGVSEQRRLPRLGKIRLGVKVVNPKTGAERPREVDYFIVPPEVAKIYGEQPKELDVLFPVNDIEIIFPQAYKWYGQSRGLKCIGNGVTAYRYNEETGTMQERECPCEIKGTQCALRAHLLFILPKVSMGGIYQIDVGSYNSIIDINSGLEYIQSLIGRFAMVPLKLKRVPREIVYEGNKRIHYPLQIVFEGDIDLINALRGETTRILATTNVALPAIEDVNPRFDEEAVVVVDETEEEEPQPVQQIQQPAPQPVQQVTQAQTQPQTQQKAPSQTKSIPIKTQQSQTQTKMAKDAQLNAIRAIALKAGFEEEIVDAFLSQGLTVSEASELIKSFNKKDFTALENYQAEILGEEVEIPEEITTQQPF